MLLFELTYAQGLLGVMHDFTQYYKPPAVPNGA